MTVFVDTSALYAVFDPDDSNHAAAKATWSLLLETTALLQHRLGVAAVRDLHESIVPLLQVDWVGEEEHHSGMEALLAASRKKLSLVDCVSFQTMRRYGVRTAFCFDAHFAEQGFVVK